MKYIIDEKDLKDMLNQYLLSSADNIEDDVYRLLIDKQHVELLAEGNIEYISWKPFKEDESGKVFSGEHIKIYIGKK